MNIYYVFQGKTHEVESAGNYLWSPQKSKTGGFNQGFTNMGKVKEGDVIFHGANAETYAISIAKEDSYESDQPEANKNVSGETVWNNKGYRVDSEYTILKSPLIMREHYSWFADNYNPESAFTVNGTGKQIYLSILAEEHAKYILSELLLLDQNSKSVQLIESILQDTLYEELPEYNQSELEHINTLIKEKTVEDREIKWQGKKKEKEFSNPSSTKKKIPKRNAVIAANALKIANYLCEVNKDHKVFLRKNEDVNYTEPHHLIPLSKHEDFDYNLDVEENIVSLCSHCHNLLHYGRLEDKIEILEKFYRDRKDALKNVGLKLDDFEELIKYYQ